jgi:cytoskeletal protein RodZ
MAAMRRGLVHVLAWLLATGAAVTLSWWGVHTVMAGTAYDPPRALPITAADSTTQESRPLASSTNRPPTHSESPSPTPSGTPSTTPAATPSATTAAPSATAAANSPAPAGSPAPVDSGNVKSYDTRGGRAVFDLGDASATLVSATPATGWSMQVWKTESWIRVEFASGADRVTVFCTWHDGPPHVEVETY